jgi:hypothetical protein
LPFEATTAGSKGKEYENISADYILPLNILYRENRDGVPLKRGLGLIVHTYAMRR